MGHDALTNLTLFALQVCLIASVAAVVLGVLRIASAGTRYLCWRLVLAVCLVMPLLLQRTVPTGMPDASRAAVSTDAVTVDVPGLEAPVATLPSAPAPQPIPWGTVAMLIVAAGGAGRVAWLAIGLLRLRALRRHGERVDDEDYDEIQRTLGTRATLLSVAGLTQPATFGLWRPVVLLPDTLGESRLALRRAVVTHELFHVQRRDWLWVLAEESLRSLIWFHPAILWLTSRIQLAREELVDELTVLATGNRKVYIEALLAFADASGVRPAPAFARRRHLFTRILRLSKERAMSSPRIVVSAAAVIMAVVAAGWYAGSVFPILSAAPAAQPPLASPIAVPEVVATRSASKIPTAPGNAQWNGYLRETQESLRVLAENSGRFRVVSQSDFEKGLKRVANEVAGQGARSGGAPRPGPAAVAPSVPPTGTKPITPENPIPRRLSSIPVSYPASLRGSGYRGVVRLQVTLDASGTISNVLRIGAELGGGDAADPAASGRAVEAFSTAASDAVRQWRYQAPADPPISFFVTVRFDGEQDATTGQSDRPEGLGGARVGGPAVPAADFLRDQLVLGEGRLDFIRAQRAQAAAQFGDQDPRVLDLNKQLQAMERELERARVQYTASLRAAQSGDAGAPGARVAGPGSTTGQPVRVGGTIRPPTKTAQVNPEYPELAKTARVQGVVIIEATIDEQGRVAEARVLRSIPLLDQAALDSVRQWEFTPTLLNGLPVPVIMTVTVQFTLPPQ